MWQNIVVILLIISLSYLFRQTSSKGGNNNVNTFDNFNFYQYLITGFKIKLAIEETRKSINNNESFSILLIV